jgi:hypothetical protein
VDNHTGGSKIDKKFHPDFPGDTPTQDTGNKLHYCGNNYPQKNPACQNEQSIP